MPGRQEVVDNQNGKKERERRRRKKRRGRRRKRKRRRRNLKDRNIFLKYRILRTKLSSCHVLPVINFSTKP